MLVVSPSTHPMIRNRLFLSVVSGHFAVDMLNSMGAVLLAVLAVPLGLSNTQIGTALTVYILFGSLSQPVFGWLADRVPGKHLLLIGLSILWMIGCYTAVAFAPSWAMLFPFFLAAALGSGLFHPIGTAMAAASNPERAGSATASFFFFGQMGLALGPVLAGLLADLAGAKGIVPLAIVALAPAALAFSAIPRERELLSRPRKAKPANETQRVWDTTAIMLVVAFIVLVATRSSIQSVYQSFLPKLFSDRGWDPSVYGLLSGVFMAAAAFGNIISGDIADRFGMRAATVWPLLLSIPAGLLCLLNVSLISTFVACGLAGLLVGGQHSVLVVHAQRLLPARQGFAAGLILGFTFATGAIGTWWAGIAADTYGLAVVMQWATWLALPTALLALTLPGRVRPAAAGAPAARATGD